MEKASDRRRRKLETLVRKHAAAAGQPDKLKVGIQRIADRAAAKGVSANPVYLDQILKGTLLPPKGPDKVREPRGLGNALARKLEWALDLGEGWFDADETVGLTTRAILLGQAFDALPEHAKAVTFAKTLRALEKAAEAPVAARAATQKAAARAPAASPKREPARRSKTRA